MVATHFSTAIPNGSVSAYLNMLRLPPRYFARKLCDFA
jgi:hypothetical protein